MTLMRCIVIFLLVILLMTLCGVGVIRYNLPTMYSDIVDKYGTLYGVKKSLIFAVIKVESNFEKYAQSEQNAKGLMQLLDNTAIWLNNGNSDINLFDPSTNIALGAKYISYLMHKYENRLVETLAAYNAGEGNVDRWLKRLLHKRTIVKASIDTREEICLTAQDIPFKETREYVVKVQKYQNYYEKIYNLE